jgi:hypothetical protein
MVVNVEPRPRDLPPMTNPEQMGRPSSHIASSGPSVEEQATDSSRYQLVRYDHNRQARSEEPGLNGPLDQEYFAQDRLRTILTSFHVLLEDMPKMFILRGLAMLEWNGRDRTVRKGVPGDMLLPLSGQFSLGVSPSEYRDLLHHLDALVKLCLIEDYTRPGSNLGDIVITLSNDSGRVADGIITWHVEHGYLKQMFEQAVNILGRRYGPHGEPILWATDHIRRLNEVFDSDILLQETQFLSMDTRLRHFDLIFRCAR